MSHLDIISFILIIALSSSITAQSNSDLEFKGDSFLSLLRKHPNNVDDKEGTKLPYTQLRMLDGRNTSTDYYKGKSTLIFFWGINCSQCISMIPAMNEVKKSLGEHRNYLALTNDKRNHIKALLYDNPFGFDQAIPEEEFLKDLGVIGTPKLIVIDKYGIIQSVIPRDIIKSCELDHLSSCAQTIISYIEKGK